MAPVADRGKYVICKIPQSHRGRRKVKTAPWSTAMAPTWPRPYAALASTNHARPRLLVSAEKHVVMPGLVN